MIFRQLFDATSGTYTYLLASRRGGEALIAAPPASAPNHITYGRSKMASFETIFRIPSSHVLRAKFHSYGAGVPESWSHEEYDGGGEFVARYESCVHTNDDGVRTSDGWKKFDFEDVLVAAEGDLLI